MKNINSIVIKKNIFFFLKEKENAKSSLLLKEKKELLNMISKSIRKKITTVKTIFLSQKMMFGNQIILINLVIFFCEILGCKKIILDKNWNWFIKNKIIYRKYRMIIDVGEIKDYKANNFTIFDFSSNFFYYSKYIKPDLRMNIIKKEVLKNIPEFKIKSNSLYIYIRSGDIFIKSYNRLYSQPPLCFYQTIINNNIINKTFDDIYIISKDKKNPVINCLLNQYKNIIYKQNDIKTDIGQLIKAYNIVGAVSTFINIIIRLNDNAKNNILPEYLQLVMQNKSFVNQVEKLEEGFQLRSIKTSSIENVEIYIPTVQRQKKKLQNSQNHPRKICKNFKNIP